MLNHSDIMSTVDMIDHQHLDIRTITMGISLLDCADPNPEACARKVHDKICRQAEHLVATGCQIERELGIPIVNKRISVTPIALVASACETEDFVPFAKAMDSAAKTCGVDFIGGFSALVQKGMAADRRHPAGAGRDGTGLLQRQRRLDKGGHQHGRCAPYGAGDQKDGRADKGTRWTWLREARRVLQRGRG